MTDTTKVEGPKDDWAGIAKSYANLTKGPTIPPIQVMLEKANAIWPFSEATSILDNGSGPGPVINALLTKYGPSIPADTRLKAADNSPAMVQEIVNLIQEHGRAGDAIWERLETDVLDAQDFSKVPEESFSHVVSGMMYMLVPDPFKALLATHKVLTTKNGGGVLALSCWEGSEWMDMMEKFNVVSDKPGPALPEVWKSAQGVKSELERAGYVDVEVVRVPTTMGYTSHENTIDFFLEKIPWMVQHANGMPAEKVARGRQIMLDYMKSLHPEPSGDMNGVALVAVCRRGAQSRI